MVTPPEPPRPDGPVERPGSITVTVLVMWVGLVLEVATTVLLFFLTDEMSAVLREEALKEPGLGSEVDTFVTIMTTVIIVGMTLFTLVAVGLWVWMIVVVGRGRTWARITATVLGALSLASGAMNLLFVAIDGTENQVQLFNGSMVLGGAAIILNVGYYVAVAVALVLLWLPASSRYFRDATAQSRWDGWAARHRPTGE